MAAGPAPARADDSAFVIKVSGFGVGVAVGVGAGVAVAGGIGVGVGIEDGVEVGTRVTFEIPTDSGVGAPTFSWNQGVLTEQPASNAARIPDAARRHRCRRGEADLSRIQPLCACARRGL